MRIQELMKNVRFDEIKPILEQSELKSQNLQVYENTFHTLRDIQPTFDYFDMAVGIKRMNGRVMVTNTHIGSISDLAGRTITISPKDHFTLPEIAAHLLYQITAHGYDTDRYKDHLEDWDDDMMTDTDGE